VNAYAVLHSFISGEAIRLIDPGWAGENHAFFRNAAFKK
jgi:hypothetical protein